MPLVGSNPTKRRGIRVESTITLETEPSVPEVAPIIDTANYIAQLCAEMVLMAKAANLPLLAHLLAMAQAEAEYVEQMMM